ncbi:MAG: GNAT family N-acetyltransferase [Acidobacteria bacterium]|nr:GNAT family N-acetyltransferase [Acidobacteriota bacterium]
MLRIQQVNPGSFAESASRILLQSWPVTCFHYSPDHLRWQFSFPGPYPSVGVAAFDGNEPVGFAAATPRRLRFQQMGSETYVVSFVAVRPAWRGRGIAADLYTCLLGALREAGLPIVTFAEPGAVGERALVKAYPSAGFELRTLGRFTTYGYSPRSGAAPTSVQVLETSDAATILATIQRRGDHQTLWSDPDCQWLEHNDEDPWLRATVILRLTGGDGLGCAMIVRSEFVTAKGISLVPMIDQLFLYQPEAEALRALCEFASERWSGPAARTNVTVPNAWGIDPMILRSAGLRQTPRQFTGYVCSPDPHCPFLNAQGTNLHIV